MHSTSHTLPERQLALAAGALYVLIIATGLTSELLLRAPLIEPGDVGVTAARIAAAPERLGLSILGDAVMVIADVALALVLFALFRPVSVLLAVWTTAMRLVQAAVIAAGLPQLWAAGHWARVPDGETMAATAMTIHGVGYDLGLIFFGVATLALAHLVRREGGYPALLAWLLAAAGLTYITGSVLRVLSPELNAAFQPAYLIAIVAEIGFALALLRRGLAASGRTGPVENGG